jgi:RecG-like helicase
MKKFVLAALVAGITMAFTPKASAADAKTLTCEGKCGKCALKETKECQNTVTVKEGDKSVIYYLVQNDVSKEFHDNICKGTKKVKAVGTVKEVDGKMQLTATKIEVVKE